MPQTKYTADTWPSDRWPNFSWEEMRCKHTGLCRMDEAFMDALQVLRSTYGDPLIVTSGYRDPSHPVEAAKNRPGVHAHGIAVDLAVSGEQAMAILALALDEASYFTGIGLMQHGPHSGRFIHLDTGEGPRWPRPALWTYGG